jgi:predicted Zn-dependent protease with MMP-like domain
MKRERFNRLVEEALATLPAKFRSRIHNVAILVEDYPPGRDAKQRPRPQRASSEPSELQDPGSEAPSDENGEELLMGMFIGTPATEKSVWDTAVGPDRVVLYQKNIEAVCESEDEIREEVRLTVLHELGHYFGMSEDQLEDV